MANPNKAKGDRFERYCCEYLTQHTKFTVRRRFGAGQQNDLGDLEGLPGMVIQAADWTNKTDALRMKPPMADSQALRVHPDTLGVTAIKPAAVTSALCSPKKPSVDSSTKSISDVTCTQRPGPAQLCRRWHGQAQSRQSQLLLD